MADLKEFVDRGTGRKFLYFKDGNTYFVFEDDKLFYKGEAEEIGKKIEELRGTLQFIAFRDNQEKLYNLEAVDFKGHYKVTTNTPEINGIYYRTDLFIGNERVWTKVKES